MAKTSGLSLQLTAAADHAAGGDTAQASAEAVSDGELVARCRAGEQAAFRGLYRRYVGKVRAALFRLGDARQLDDLTQEVFLRVWTAIGGLHEPARLSTWIYRIAVNTAVDSLRGIKGDRRHLVPLAELSAEPASRQNIEADVRHSQQAQAALAVLDFDHRAVLVLHDLEGLTQTEIAEVLAVAVGTVKSRLHHARRKAREFLVTNGVSL